MNIAKGVKNASEIIGTSCFSPWSAGKVRRKKIIKAMVEVNEIIGSSKRAKENKRK